MDSTEAKQIGVQVADELLNMDKWKVLRDVSCALPEVLPEIIDQAIGDIMPQYVNRRSEASKEAEIVAREIAAAKVCSVDRQDVFKAVFSVALGEDPRFGLFGRPGEIKQGDEIYERAIDVAAERVTSEPYNFKY